MKLIRIFLLLGIIIIAVSWFSNSAIWKKTKALHRSKKETAYTVKFTTKEKLEQKAAVAKRFVQEKGFNDKLCFLIDMSLASGQNRFFIYNLKSDSLQAKGLVAHGNCFQYWLEGRKYSNVVGSGCTSLGRYKVGASYTGKFGYSYKLHGLDTSNNNAFERTVVLHSHSCIPDAEISDEICQSNGCPAVSLEFLNQLKAIINTTKKPVLLWIYE
jgi:L,D-transpeptidase catalytic domain